SAADAAHKTIGNEILQFGMTKQETVVGPFIAPRKDDQYHPQHRAEEHKQKHAEAVRPHMTRMAVPTAGSLSGNVVGFRITQWCGRLAERYMLVCTHARPREATAFKA